MRAIIRRSCSSGMLSGPAKQHAFSKSFLMFNILHFDFFWPSLWLIMQSQQNPVFLCSHRKNNIREKVFKPWMVLYELYVSNQLGIAGKVPLCFPDKRTLRQHADLIYVQKTVERYESDNGRLRCGDQIHSLQKSSPTKSVSRETLPILPHWRGR